MKLGAVQAALADRYEVDREIGHGGMAVVYHAREVARGRVVALKVLRPEFAVSVTADRFHREVEILAALDHPNILSVIDSSDTGPYIYYTMPYAPGGSLRALLEVRGQFPLPEALAIVRDVARAVDHAHAHNVIHRDIKPENILFGEDGRAMVCDFGVARAIERAASEDISSSGLVVGTPMYMSPEQAAAEKDLDGRTDIYALGAVLYEMLVGEPPFTGVTAQAVIARVTKERPPPITVVRPDVPAAVAEAVEAALAKRRRDRPRTGAAFLKRLER